jgi:hypothetical protein
MQYEDIERQEVQTGINVVIHDACEVGHTGFDMKRTGMSWDAVLFQTKAGGFVVDIYCEYTDTGKTVKDRCQMMRFGNVKELSSFVVGSTSLMKHLWNDAKKNSDLISDCTVEW